MLCRCSGCKEGSRLAQTYAFGFVEYFYLPINCSINTIVSFKIISHNMQFFFTVKFCWFPNILCCKVSQLIDIDEQHLQRCSVEMRLLVLIVHHHSHHHPTHSEKSRDQLNSGRGPPQQFNLFTVFTFTRFTHTKLTFSFDTFWVTSLSFSHFYIIPPPMQRNVLCVSYDDVRSRACAIW